MIVFLSDYINSLAQKLIKYKMGGLASALLKIRFRYNYHISSVKLVDISSATERNMPEMNNSSELPTVIYDSFGHIHSHEIYKTWIATFRNCIINYGSSFVVDLKSKRAYGDLWHIADKNSNYTEKPIKYAFNGHALYLNESRTILKVGKGILLAGKASYNYYHLMVEIMPRLFIVDSINKYDQYPLIIDRVLIETPSFKEIITIFNKKDRPIIILEKDKAYEIDEVVLANDGARMPINVFNMSGYGAKTFVIAPYTVQFIRNTVFESESYKTKPAASYPEKIFIGRKSSLSRRPCNEDELWEIAQRHGFTKVYPEDYSFIEQVNMFSNCRALLANTGAALTNILFMSQHSKILYWVSETNKEINFFTTIAKMNNCSIEFITGVPKDAKSMHGYFEVSKADFEQRLNQF